MLRLILFHYIINNKKFLIKVLKFLNMGHNTPTLFNSMNLTSYLTSIKNPPFDPFDSFLNFH